MLTERIIADVQDERKRQDELHGPANGENSATDWMAILGEEYGEASEQALKLRYGSTWSAIRAITLREFRMELIHTAAVALKVVELLDSQPDAERHETLRTTVPGHERHGTMVAKDHARFDLNTSPLIGDGGPGDYDDWR